jgi:inorganic triphosphatase YgiF
MTVSHPVEIELKLALPPQQVASFLTLMARRRSVPVQQAMRTLYFDTPDFALSAQGVALRVRRVGRRWLQTIKTEGERSGGLSQRAEFETTIMHDTPDWSRFPAEALVLVPEALRTQLVPAFETRFERTTWQHSGGGARIEVALDLGEIRAGERSQPICEVELELKAGQPDALFELAQGWVRHLDFVPLDVSKAERGVRLAHGIDAGPVKSVPMTLNSGASVEEGFAAMCQNCLAQFQANLPGVLAPLPTPAPLAGEAASVMPKSMAAPPSDGTSSHSTKPASEQVAGYPQLSPQMGERANVTPNPIDDSIEYVHQARVALRRLRAVLRLHRRACVLPQELMDGLRALTAALGPARDWDVLCGETLPTIAPHYVDAETWQRGIAALQAHRIAVREAMQVALGQAHPGAWLLTCQRWLLQRGWRAAPEAQRFVQLSPLQVWARRALKKGHRPIVCGARDFLQLQPPQRHALRIAIKRQRYATEFFQTVFAGTRHAQYLAVLRDAQDSLGRANDAHVALQLLTAGHVDAGPMGHFVLGWLAAKQAEAVNDESATLMRAFLKLKVYW